jgi:hypothetical protein
MMRHLWWWVGMTLLVLCIGLFTSVVGGAFDHYVFGINCY